MKLFKIFICGCLLFPALLFAQTQTTQYQASSLQQKARIFISPASGTFIEGSTFEVPIYIDTFKKSINTVELHIKFDPKKLTIVNPAGGKSIIGFWISQPTYSNTTGTIDVSGSIPQGITTDSGLITTITFKAIGLGDTGISISDTSQIFANDGLGSQVATSFTNGRYTITAQPPQGIPVYSETHPSPETWSNNSNPSFSWDMPPGITDTSFIFDTKPFTIPDNTSEGPLTTVGYENVADGVSYFHIKARKKSVWGGTTHFPVRVDTTPPAQFKVNYEFLTASVLSNHTLLSFFTTDSLSGIDHYEVGIIDKKADANQAPLFVQASSPYQIPTPFTGDIHVIVRAFDAAGNVTDSSVDVHVPTIASSISRNKAFLIVSFLLLLSLTYGLIHFIVHHLRKSRRQDSILPPQPPLLPQP